MGLVDLRGRADDAAVQALAARLLAGEEAGGVAATPSLLIGWAESEELVGGLGIERVGEREIELKDVFVSGGEAALQGEGLALP